MKSVLSLLCAAVLALSAHADSVTVNPAADTTISEGGSAGTAWNADNMIVGRLTANGNQAISRGMIRFDLPTLPANTVVTSATLTVSITRAHSTPNSHALNRITAPWSHSLATWENSGFGAWTGGSFVEEADSTTTLGGDQSGVTVTGTFPSTPALVAAVQTWLTNASENYGWILRNADEETLGNARRISSREAALGLKPVLTIGYFVDEPPPPPADFNVISPGFFYNINGDEPNPEITLTRGSNYVFEINTDLSHPFQIASGPNFGGPAYNNGVSNNTVSMGRIAFNVPLNAPDTLYYVCAFHFFGNVIHIVEPVVPPGPVLQIVSMNLSASNVVLRSLATNGWPAIPEYSSNLVSSNWAVVPAYSNALVNGTNITIFNRLDPICGPNVYLRVKNSP